MREKPGRPKGYWELRVDLGADPVTGQRRRISRGFRGGKRAAENALRELVSEVMGGRHAATDGTVAQLMARWLDRIAPDRSPTTMKRYRTIVANHIEPTFGATPLRKLRRADINDLYARLRKQGLAPATIRQVHAVLHRALEVGVSEDWLATNPAANTARPKVARPHLVAPELTQVARLIARAEEVNPEFAVFLRLAAATGARRGELCGLRWSDVDVEASTLLIDRAVVNTSHVKDTKRNKGRRIALDHVTVTRLKLHRAAMESRAITACATYGDDAYLFSPDPAGTLPWHPDSMTHEFVRLRDECGLPELQLKNLRHGHATHLMASGVDLRTVAGRLGHDPRMTMGVYAQFERAADRKAADVIGELLSPD
jgi:integrase